MDNKNKNMLVTIEDKHTKKKYILNASRGNITWNKIAVVTMVTSNNK